MTLAHLCPALPIQPDRYLYTVHLYICNNPSLHIAKLIYIRVVNLAYSGLVNLSENRNGEFWWRRERFYK